MTTHDRPTTPSPKRRSSRLVLALVLASFGLAATATAAHADQDWNHRGHDRGRQEHRGWQNHRGHDRYRHRDYRQGYYAPPPPVYYGAPTFSFGLNIPLNR